MNRNADSKSNSKAVAMSNDRIRNVVAVAGNRAAVVGSCC